MKRRKMCVSLLVTVLAVATLAGCGKAKTNETKVEQVKDNMEISVPLKVNLCNGDSGNTITYNQSQPITLSDGTVVTAGNLKPVWSYMGTKLNVAFEDVALQDAKAIDMMRTESATDFSGANIYGGNSIADEFMTYGTQGKFTNLSDMMEKGAMPNFQKYLTENPDIKSAITGYDGSIYYVPYSAEIGNYARTFCLRESWVTSLLNASNAAYDSSAFATVYDGFYVGSNQRTGANGGTVSPKEGVTVTKKTNQNIIEIQNKLVTKNGKTLTDAFVKYIKDNYSYTNPSELFLGEKAAYDIDELVALFRCIKANPSYLTNGKANTVWPLFTRKSSYREDLLRLATYFDGVHVNGSDSYGARFYVDKDGSLQYAYDKKGIYDVLTYLSDMESEGLIYSDCYDLTNTKDFRKLLWGTDTAATPTFGFMTFDWIASSTTASLNNDTVVVLPPAAKVNGVWQYYIENTRAIKPDGWAISVAGSTDEQVLRACTLFDYMFSDEGKVAQNYGLPMDVELNGYKGPDGVSYPKFNPWVKTSADTYSKGDFSNFLRNYMGSLLTIGYQKEIGFEYQYTSEKGFAGWKLLQDSTTNTASYAGTGIDGDNKNYYKLLPTVFSLTQRQNETVTTESAMTTQDTALTEYLFNIVRYNAKGNAPSGTTLPKSFDEYKLYFGSLGIDKYMEAYSSAFKIMSSK